MVKEQPFVCTDAELQRIYDVSVYTLRLCMHEHYEDCPWSEQALYIMDSRNQMLCGYYAFKEYAFPRASLRLFAKTRRSDGLLPICAPAGCELASEMGVTVCDCYAKWKKLAETEDITMLLVNRINHPISEMHSLFTDSLYDAIMDDTSEKRQSDSTMYCAK